MERMLCDSKKILSRLAYAEEREKFMEQISVMGKERIQANQEKYKETRRKDWKMHEKSTENSVSKIKQQAIMLEDTISELSDSKKIVDSQTTEINELRMEITRLTDLLDRSHSCSKCASGCASASASASSAVDPYPDGRAAAADHDGRAAAA
jgi:hypothetical protein